MPKIYAGLRFLSSEVRGLQAAVYILAVCALLSSVLALVRDRLFAHVFGAGIELDLYNAAFRIPDLLFVTTAALVSAYVLMPELSRRDKQQSLDYIDTVVAGFSLLVIPVSAALAWFAPAILAVLFPEFARQGLLPTLVDLTRVMLLQPILFGFSNILASITQSERRYALYAISPLLYNLGIIIGLLCFYPVFGLIGLAWGVVFGACMHVGIQVPSILADGYFRRLPRIHDMRVLLATAATSVPRSLALTMSQVSYTGLVALAAGLVPGSIAIFAFAYNLQAVPLSIIGASYSVAAFPVLAKAAASGKHAEFIDYIARAARHILFWSLPASALIIVLRAYVVRVILGSGAFDWADTRLTAACFAILSLSLVAQGLTLLIARGYYATGRSFVPFTAAAATAAMTIGFAYTLILVLKDAHAMRIVEDVTRAQGGAGGAVVALALAYAFASIIGTIGLITHFSYTYGGFLHKVKDAIAQSSIAALAAGVSAYGALALTDMLSLSSISGTVFVRGFVGGVVGMAGAALAYALLRNREYSETVSTIRAKIWRTPLPQAQTIVSAEDVAQ